MAWSAERGRLGLIVPAGSSREAMRRRALMMPLSLFEGEVDFRPNTELFNIKDIRPLTVLSSISASPSKSIVAMFVAEVLEKVLRDSPPDEILSEFIFRSIELLDGLSSRGVANFPVVFLCRLGALMGIEPDASEWNPGKIFDMIEGVYRTSAPAHRRWLSPEETNVANIVQRLTFASGCRLSIPRKVRREILDRILEYFTIHLAPLDSLKTLSVLRDLL